MTRASIKFTVEQEDYLRRESERTGNPKATIVRTALMEYMRNHPQNEENIK